MPLRVDERSHGGICEGTAAAVGADGQPISPPGRRIIGVRPPTPTAPAPLLTIRQNQSPAAEFDQRVAADTGAHTPGLQDALRPPVEGGVPGREVPEGGAEFTGGVAACSVSPVSSTVPSCTEVMSGVPSTRRERVRGASNAWAAFPDRRASGSAWPRTAMWLSGSFSYARTYPPRSSAASTTRLVPAPKAGWLSVARDRVPCDRQPPLAAGPSVTAASSAPPRPGAPSATPRRPPPHGPGRAA